MQKAEKENPSDFEHNRHWDQDGDANQTPISKTDVTFVGEARSLAHGLESQLGQYALAQRGCAKSYADVDKPAPQSAHGFRCRRSAFMTNATACPALQSDGTFYCDFALRRWVECLNANTKGPANPIDAASKLKRGAGSHCRKC